MTNAENHYFIGGTYVNSFRSFARLLAAALLLIQIGACANMAKPLNTPTGRPDVVIENGDLPTIKNTITNVALNWGFYVKQVSDYVAIYEKREEGVLNKALLGSQYDSTPVWRLTFNYATLNGAVRVVANIHAVTNPGSAFERVSDLSTDSQDANNVQKMLESIKTATYRNQQVLNSSNKCNAHLPPFRRT